MQQKKDYKAKAREDGSILIHIGLSTDLEKESVLSMDENHGYNGIFRTTTSSVGIQDSIGKQNTGSEQCIGDEGYSDIEAMENKYAEKTLEKDDNVASQK